MKRFSLLLVGLLSIFGSAWAPPTATPETPTPLTSPQKINGISEYNNVTSFEVRGRSIMVTNQDGSSLKLDLVGKSKKRPSCLVFKNATNSSFVLMGLKSNTWTLQTTTPNDIADLNTRLKEIPLESIMQLIKSSYDNAPERNAFGYRSSDFLQTFDPFKEQPATGRGTGNSGAQAAQKVDTISGDTLVIRNADGARREFTLQGCTNRTNVFFFSEKNSTNNYKGTFSDKNFLIQPARKEEFPALDKRYTTNLNTALRGNIENIILNGAMYPAPKVVQTTPTPDGGQILKYADGFTQRRALTGPTTSLIGSVDKEKDTPTVPVKPASNVSVTPPTPDSLTTIDNDIPEKKPDTKTSVWENPYAYGTGAALLAALTAVGLTINQQGEIVDARRRALYHNNMQQRIRSLERNRLIGILSSLGLGTLTAVLALLAVRHHNQA